MPPPLDDHFAQTAAALSGIPLLAEGRQASAFHDLTYPLHDSSSSGEPPLALFEQAFAVIPQFCEGQQGGAFESLPDIIEGVFGDRKFHLLGSALPIIPQLAESQQGRAFGSLGQAYGDLIRAIDASPSGQRKLALFDRAYAFAGILLAAVAQLARSQQAHAFMDFSLALEALPDGQQKLTLLDEAYPFASRLLTAAPQLDESLQALDSSAQHVSSSVMVTVHPVR